MTRTSAMKKWTAMSVVVILHNAAAAAVAEPHVPCFFLFGDSMIDNGNNNDKITAAKANFPPYGIDFPAGPTGRFSNGKTTGDAIAELLGFEDFIPPYASAGGYQILRGVNYASAAAGIRPESGIYWGDRTYFGGQVTNFNNTVAQIAGLLGDQHKTANHLSKCIYLVEIGINDIINNYLLPSLYTTSRKYSISQFITLLIQQYSDELRILYGYGARKFALFGLLPSGCCPWVLARSSPDGSTCVETYNKPSQLFNEKLVALVDDLNTNFPASRFTFINGYDFTMDALNNASAYGFKVKNTACCGKGKNNATVICLPKDTPCKNRDEYVFWDFAHPTEAAAKVFAKRAHRAQKPSDAYPFDISTLAKLQI